MLMDVSASHFKFLTKCIVFAYKFYLKAWISRTDSVTDEKMSKAL